ncbi:MAG TPA: phospholipase D-like domain-containing protein [Candidatus Paceibacterota bacterium]|nr:phospholipase D-like domain-containing protein [Candidatus Paceibacterota bacterium]
MSDTTWKFHLSPADAWDAMYEDCATARTSIDIEQYIFAMDTLGERFFDMLIRKCREGVAVRILCDAVGSSGLLNSKTERRLVSGGIKIKFFNRIQPWRVGNVSSWFLRDHRKILLIDRSITHVGGVCLEDRMKNWRDTNVRMMGPVVTEVQADFDQMWAAVPRHRFPKLRPLFKEGEDFSFLTNSPKFRGRAIYHDLRKHIRRAKKYIYLTTPYFIPSILLFTALQRAALRGVDVRILVPVSADIRVASIATGSYFLLALDAGIKMYRYDKERILHAKTAVIDDAWASIGSANVDNLSLLLNFEGNLRSSNPGFIAELKQQFLDDLSHAKMVTKENWVKRPMTLKLLEAITWPIHGIL